MTAFAIAVGKIMKKNGIKTSTLRIAVCAVIAALSLALMLLTSVVPIGTYVFPCFAGIFLTVIVVEFGLKWALLVYLVVSVLSLFLSGDKEAAAFFIMLFGYYPILKNIFERKLKHRGVRIILKLLVFNAAAIAAFFVTTWLLAIPAEEYTIMGVYIPWAFLIAGNIFFIIYDMAVSVFVKQYITRLRGKILGNKY